MVLEGKSGFQSLGKEDIEKKIKEMEKFIDEHLSKRIPHREATSRLQDVEKIKEMEKFIDEHLPRRLSREMKPEKTSEKVPSKEDIEKKIKEMEKFIDEHLKPETIFTHQKIEKPIRERPVVEGQKRKDEGILSESLAIESMLEQEEKEKESIKKEQIENEFNEENVIEHVLFDEEDPFFLEETRTEIIGREYINDVELPKESLRFKPHVEFRPPEEAGQIDIPVKGEKFEEIDFYPIEEPFAYVKILREKETFEKVYLLIEPELTEEESKVLNFLEETISSTVVPEIAKIEDAKRYLEREVEYIINDYGISLPTASKHKIIYMLKRDFLGFGKIDALMKDPDIEDISCDGAGLPVFIYHRKHGSLKTNVVFDNEEELSSFVMRLAQKCGKHVSLADPLLDATLPDGSRVQLTLGEEVTTKGSTFTIRKFRSTPFSPIELVKMNTLSPEMLAYLWLAVEHGASGIFAGGTASGKTTTLNAISLFIPKEAKIVSIEETREINLPHPNWIPGVTRTGFGEVVADKVVGEIDMYDLLKAALRQRPEYIIVGEIRGREAYVLFQAMATGHTTYSTMHADSPQSLIHRLEGKPINIPRIMLQALDFVCFMTITRLKDKRERRIARIIEIIDIDPRTKELITNEVFSWDSINDSFKYSGRSYLLEKIRLKIGLSKQELQQEIENRIKIINWMAEKNIISFDQVSKVINEYRENPKKFMEKVEKNA